MKPVQRECSYRHLSPVRITMVLVAASLLLLSGCANKSPDEIRKETAEVTAKAKTNTKAIAQGIKEGLRSGDMVDINRAPKEKLTNLPGITDAAADRIIKNRPYDDPSELLSRHVLTKEQYDRIKVQIEVPKK